MVIFLHYFFLFLRLDNLNEPIFKYTDSFFMLLKCAVESLQWIFHFSFIFQYQNLHLVLFFLTFLSLYWCTLFDISFSWFPLILYILVPLSFLNLFKIANLKSLSCMVNVCTSSETVLSDCFSLLVHGSDFLFAYPVIVENWTFLIWYSNNENQILPLLAIAVCCICSWSLV